MRGRAGNLKLLIMGLVFLVTSPYLGAHPELTQKNKRCSSLSYHLGIYKFLRSPVSGMGSKINIRTRDVTGILIT